MDNEQLSHWMETTASVANESALANNFANSDVGTKYVPLHRHNLQYASELASYWRSWINENTVWLSLKFESSSNNRCLRLESYLFRVFSLLRILNAVLICKNLFRYSDFSASAKHLSGWYFNDNRWYACLISVWDESHWQSKTSYAFIIIALAIITIEIRILYPKKHSTPSFRKLRSYGHFNGTGFSFSDGSETWNRLCLFMIRSLVEETICTSKSNKSKFLTWYHFWIWAITPNRFRNNSSRFFTEDQWEYQKNAFCLCIYFISKSKDIQK